jgi:hypothetical protein
MCVYVCMPVCMYIGLYMYLRMHAYICRYYVGTIRRCMYVHMYVYMLYKYKMRCVILNWNILANNVKYCWLDNKEDTGAIF